MQEVIPMKKNPYSLADVNRVEVQRLIEHRRDQAAVVGLSFLTCRPMLMLAVHSHPYVRPSPAIGPALGGGGHLRKQIRRRD
jgi:hypothetical protein